MSDIIVKQGLISQPNLAKWLDLSRSGLEKLRKKDLTFPEPIKNGHHQQSACHYVFAEVEAWINSRISDRDSDSQRSRLIAAAPEQRERVELTDAEIEERWWGELDNRSLSSIRAVIAAYEAKRASWSQSAKKSTHDGGRVEETLKNVHVCVPEGMVMVPMKPTERMLDHAVSFALNVGPAQSGGWTEYARRMWETMVIAAASQQDADKAQGVAS